MVWCGGFRARGLSAAGDVFWLTGEGPPLSQRSPWKPVAKNPHLSHGAILSNRLGGEAHGRSARRVRQDEGAAKAPPLDCLQHLPCPAEAPLNRRDDETAVVYEGFPTGRQGIFFPAAQNLRRFAGTGRRSIPTGSRSPRKRGFRAEKAKGVRSKYCQSRDLDLRQPSALQDVACHTS
jgi:hypothetical protein